MVTHGTLSTMTVSSCHSDVVISSAFLVSFNFIFPKCFSRFSTVECVSSSESELLLVAGIHFVWNRGPCLRENVPWEIGAPFCGKVSHGKSGPFLLESVPWEIGGPFCGYVSHGKSGALSAGMCPMGNRGAFLRECVPWEIGPLSAGMCPVENRGPFLRECVPWEIGAPFSEEKPATTKSRCSA